VVGWRDKVGENVGAGETVGRIYFSNFSRHAGSSVFKSVDPLMPLHFMLPVNSLSSCKLSSSSTIT